MSSMSEEKICEMYVIDFLNDLKNIYKIPGEIGSDNHFHRVKYKEYGYKDMFCENNCDYYSIISNRYSYYISKFDILSIFFYNKGSRVLLAEEMKRKLIDNDIRKEINFAKLSDREKFKIERHIIKMFLERMAMIRNDYMSDIKSGTYDSEYYLHNSSFSVKFDLEEKDRETIIKDFINHLDNTKSYLELAKVRRKELIDKFESYIYYVKSTLEQREKEMLLKESEGLEDNEELVKPVRNRIILEGYND